MSSFTAPLDLRAMPDGRVALLRPLAWYTDDPKHRVTVPLGFLTDGSSIPRPFWPIVGHPLSSTVVRSGALHDWLYHSHRWDNTRTISRAAADREFRVALQIDGTGPARRWVMWAAVRTFGYWAWTSPKRDRIDANTAAEVWRIRHAIAETET